MERKKNTFFESIVVGMIFLVIIQTFLEDLFVLLGVSWNTRKILIVTAVMFDIFFSLEFFVRLYNALAKRKVKTYLVRERGWIDFAASIPLLLFNSGPMFFALISGATGLFGFAGILNILKVVKAIRIARVLRLLRVLKIFRQIKYANSSTAQHHISKITSIAITSIVSVLFFSSLLTGLTGLPGSDGLMEEYHQRTSTLLMSSKFPLINEISRVYDDLLIIKEEGETIYSSLDNRYYEEEFGPMDYVYISEGTFGFFYDIRALNKISAKDNLTYFFIILLITFGFLAYYSPHFALTVTDPIHVMSRGMKERNYNFEVKTGGLLDDDVCGLSKAYNEIFLPMKGRETDGSELESDIKIDNVDDLFKEL